MNLYYMLPYSILAEYNDGKYSKLISPLYYY